MRQVSTSVQNVKSLPRFRRAVKVALAERDWTQDQLARRIKRSRQAVNRSLKHGEFPAVAAQIAKALDIAL